MSLTRRIFPFLLAFCLSLGASRTVMAHAIIVESSPAIDSSVNGPRVEIRLRFNSRLDHDRSRLTLIGPDGADRRLVVSPTSAADMLQATASGLGAGAYKLRWQVLAVDGHITRGDIPFRVTQP
jgi:copper resistance protein C